MKRSFALLFCVIIEQETKEDNCIFLIHGGCRDAENRFVLTLYEFGKEREAVEVNAVNLIFFNTVNRSVKFLIDDVSDEVLFLETFK